MNVEYTPQKLVSLKLIHFLRHIFMDKVRKNNEIIISQFISCSSTVTKH